MKSSSSAESSNHDLNDELGKSARKRGARNVVQFIIGSKPKAKAAIENESNETISRKVILEQVSRSQSQLNLNIAEKDEFEECWFSQEKLFKDHIQEILNKWEQIDDEIWGKIIYMERNRRLAKAYARAPILTIDGSEDGFDGHRIGLNGFESFQEDSLIRRIKRHIGQGVQVRIDETGSVIVKLISNSDVSIGIWNDGLSKRKIDLSTSLEYQKSIKVFDMKTFQNGIHAELRNTYPDRRRLEQQCISILGFGRNSDKSSVNLLDSPVWCLLVNIVALDMLKSKIPPIDLRVAYPLKSKSSSNDKENSEKESFSDLSFSTGSSRSAKEMSSHSPPELPPRDKKQLRFSELTPVRVYRHYPVGNFEQQIKQAKHPRDYDPYYYGYEAHVSERSLPGQRGRSIAHPVQPRSAPLRRPHSSGYLNTVFSQSIRPQFFPAPMNWVGNNM